MFRSAFKPTPSFAGATVVRRKPSLDFSVTGLVYCSMMMFMGLAALNSQANLLFGVFGLMVGTLFITWVISRGVLFRVRVDRVLPETAVVGQPATITYQFTNEKRLWPSLSIGVAEMDGNEAFTKQPVSYMLHAAPRMTAVVPTDVVPKRRGLHTLDRYQISTSFPFGFIKRAADQRQKDTLLVYPALGKVDHKLLTMCRSAEKTGPTMRPKRGGVDEFYGVKEYQAGDNPKWIYWRRSARTGVVVSKEMTQVSPPRLLLLVDTFLPDRTQASHVAVEQTIAMAASLASHALEAGMSVGSMAWSGHWACIAPNRGKRHRRELLSVLACLPLNQAQNTQALLDHCGELLKSGTTPVLLTPGDVQVGLSEHLRTGMLVLGARSPQASRWFRFDPEIDFSRCMPLEQQPGAGKYH